MLSSNFEKRLNQLNKISEFSQKNHLRMLSNKQFVVNENSLNIYNPFPTAEKFHDDNHLVKCVMGPFGSGKTTMSMCDIILDAIAMPPWDNGISKSRFIIVRNTYGELISTTVKSWMSWFSELGQIYQNKHPFYNLIHTFYCNDQKYEMDIIFLALDTIRDFGKLKSLEVTGAYCNELSELPDGMIDFLLGRINRYPPKDKYQINYQGKIRADTNPPSERSWIYRDFEIKKNPDYIMLKQPPALIKNEKGEWIINELAENLKNVGKDYYLNMRNSPEEFIKVYCLGEYGTVLSGRKVYPEYNDDLHSVQTIEINKSLPIYIGLDFGLTPAAIFLQINEIGQILGIYELVADNLGFRQFVENLFLKTINTIFNGCKIAAIIGDPAGNRRSETDESRCYQILQEHGFSVISSHTNNLEPRLDSVKFFLNRLAGGHAAIQISRNGCPILRDGFLGNYHYRKKIILSGEIYDDEPFKNFYSHVQDALQYVLMYIQTSFQKPVINEAILHQYNNCRL